MRKIVAFASLAILTLLLMVPLPAYASKSFTLSYKQAEWRWHSPCTMLCPVECTGYAPLRILFPGIVTPVCAVDFGQWTPSYYRNWDTSSEFKLKGNVLHTSLTWFELGTDVEGNSMVYVYNEGEGKWIMQGGSVSYSARVRGGVRQSVTEYWRGYLEFDGTPAAGTFEHGVGYKWSYVYPDEAILDATGKLVGYPKAWWDDVMGAWLVGFSVYLWDSGTQTYEWNYILFQFIEPVPASNYNPLNL